MGHEHHEIEGNIYERYELNESLKKYLFGFIGIGALLFVLGLVLSMMGGGHEAGHGEHHGGLHTAAWLRQIFSNLLIGSYFFGGIALLAVFFIAVKTVSNAGWYVVIKRVPEAISEYLPIGLGILGLVLVAGLFSHSLYLWSDEEALKADHHYHVIKEKLGYLNVPFFLARMAVIFVLWFFFQRTFMKYSYEQDKDKTSALNAFNASFKTGAIFLFVFAITMSVAAWDWFMSIVPAWFSTMFGVYIFASSWVSALAAITLIVIILKNDEYMGYVNENHIHDLGKLVFAFSVFWTYIWFCEYLLIWYANIPEETFYFYNILHNPLYLTIFIGKFIINFIVPFLVLMTRDAKRNMKTLAIVCGLVLFGHYMDLYIAVFPGVMGHEGTFGPMEIGTFLMFAGIFGYFVFNKLTQRSMVPEHHPYLEESLHHHVF